MAEERPYLKYKADQLEKIAKENWSSISKLQIIINELNCRKSRPAKNLTLKINNRLDSLATNQTRETKSNTHDPYTILGLSESATWDMIRLAYRNKIKEYHPDRLAEDIGEELKKLAEKKSKEINNAYTMLKNEHRII